MLIANPIYDVVFKYLMEDSKVAKLLLSAIIEQEIIELEFKPQELSGELQGVKKKRGKKQEDTFIPQLTVYRLDFAAKIKTEDGEKIIIIEIQKAKLLNDVMRFRKYLGKQYQNNDYFYIKKNENGKEVKFGYPIVSIYFLGEQLDNIQGIPVVKVDNVPIDLYSGNKITQREAFVESLTHRSYIISIPDLNKKRRTELELLLSIFDQSSIGTSHHILNMREEDFPEKYRSIIKRLQNATAEAELRNQMELEDDFVSELADYERMVDEAKRRVEEAESKAEKAENKAEEAQNKAEEAQNKAEEAQNKAEEAQNKAEEAQNKAEEAQNKAEEAQNKVFQFIKKCFSKGMSIEEIAELTELSIAEIKEIEKNFKVM